MGNVCSGEVTKNQEMQNTKEIKFNSNTNNYKDQNSITPEAVKSAEKIQSHFRIKKAKNILTEKEVSLLKEFDDSILNYGAFISENEMLEKTSENVKRLDLALPPFIPTDEELSKYKHIFEKGPILFHDGSVYKGHWNYLGKKHGFGTYVKSDGSKYEGFWLNDKIHGRGRYIERAGNYYEGI